MCLVIVAWHVFLHFTFKRPPCFFFHFLLSIVDLVSIWWCFPVTCPKTLVYKQNLFYLILSLKSSHQPLRTYFFILYRILADDRKTDTAKSLVGSQSNVRRLYYVAVIKIKSFSTKLRILNSFGLINYWHRLFLL